MNKFICIISIVILNISQTYSQGLIINHLCTDLSGIPENWIDSAKVKLKITYQHTSHGSQLVSGIKAIKSAYGGVYNFSSTGNGLNANVFLNDYGMPNAGDLGTRGSLEWRDATIAILNNPACDRNVVMWSWCGGVSNNDSTGIYTYLNAMNSLETDYPSIKFVYMTGHLDGTGLYGNLNKMNNLIRDYCRNNDKILFDFADIESYTPGETQNYMEWCCLDGLNYDPYCNDPWSGSNWAEEWIAANPNHPYVTVTNNCTSCAHSSDPSEARLNCVLKGNAFWWMMASLAGWDQTTGLVDINTNLSELNIFPNPSNEVFFIKAGKNKFQKIEIYNSSGLKVYSFLNTQHSSPIKINLSFLEKGVYFVRAYNNEIYTSKIILQ